MRYVNGKTARAVAVTSTTEVTLKRDLMQSGTEVGTDMHFTSIGMCGAKSALARVEHSAVAHFTAAVETFGTSQRTLDSTINTSHTSFFVPCIAATTAGKNIHARDVQKWGSRASMHRGGLDAGAIRPVKQENVSCATCVRPRS
jgi:hypothetical protein